MVGLPQSPGVTGTALLVAGVVVGSAYAWVVWRKSSLRTVFDRRIAVLVVAAFWTSIAAAPFVTWRVVEDVRVVTQIDRAEAEVFAPYSQGLDPAVFTRLRRAIGHHETYHVRIAPTIDRQLREAFYEWSLTALLPRRATDVRRCDWIVAWGVHPASLGRPLRSTRIVRPQAGVYPAFYLGRVAR